MLKPRYPANVRVGLPTLSTKYSRVSFTKSMCGSGVFVFSQVRGSLAPGAPAGAVAPTTVVVVATALTLTLGATDVAGIERLAQAVEGQAQVGARPGVVPVGPEERSQRVTAVGTIGLYRQIGEQGARLVSGKVNDGLLADTRLEGAE